MDLTDVVPIEVVSCTSQDPPHTGKRLSSQYGVAVLRALLDTSGGGGITDDGAGWHAEKFCEYPQEIMFRVCDPDFAPHAMSLVVVSHATLIAHRIEIFLSSSIVRDWRKAQFERLGFITLQSPQDTHCAAHELKTVPLYPRANEKLTFLKLLIHTCHVHTANIFNQVGLACFVVLAETSSRQADGESLVTAVKRHTKEERKPVPTDITLEPSPKIRPWPATVPCPPKPNQRIPTASQAVWGTERKEYVTPVELLTRIQLARERHAVVLQNRVADYQRDQKQWAIDELECAQLIDKLSQLNGWEVAARTVDERLHAQQQIDAVLQSVRALDTRVSQREVLLQRLVSEALASQLANSPVRITSDKNYRGAKPAAVFRAKDVWVSLDSWRAREEFLWKVVEAVKCCGDDQRTTSQKVSMEPKDCVVLDEAIQIVVAGLKDGHAQVFIAVTTLLTSVIQRHPRFQEGSAWKQEVSLILKLLASRLDDHQPPVRNNAAFAIVKVAELTRARGTFVVHTLLVLTEKEEIQVSSQALYGLLKVFSALLVSFHCCASIDISAKRVLRLLVQYDALIHENGHVRDAARQLVVVLHSEVGSEPILTFLRKKSLPDDTMSGMEQLMAALSARAEDPVSLDGAASLR